MALAREIYQALEDIVGKKNISEDIGVCESYRSIAAQTSAHYGPFDHWTPLPQAVILPGSTEEVQNVVRICNKYKIQFKAGSTFYATMAYIGSDYAVQLDMRRMAKIEIDSKNQCAIIEPYAIAAVVQAEAMKVGLNLNIPGVGCSSSTLASTSGWAGFGPTSIFMGASGENLLSAEWVLPDGEVIKTGSAGAGAGWFCGEGPGPSFRSVFRGVTGVAGSMGVCTKIAVRLHPWPGPTFLPSDGVLPAYKAVLPDNFKCYTLCFPDWEGWTTAAAIIHENDVLYLGHRQYNMFGRNLKGAMIRILTDPEKQLCDLPELLEDPETQKHNESMKLEFQVVIAGMTKKDMEYKEKAIDEILKQSRGWKNEMMLEKDVHDWALLYLLRLGHKNLNYVLCGAYEGNFGMSSNLYVTTPLMEEASALKRKWEVEATAIAATGGDSEMGSISGIGGGGVTGWEYFTNFDAYDRESTRGTKEFFDDTQRWMTEHGLGGDFSRWNTECRREDSYNYTQEEHDSFYVKMAQPHVMAYQWKVREAFNPNHLGGSYYRTLTPDKVPEGK